MSELKVKGEIFHVGEEQVISDKFKKKEFWIKTEGEYPQEIKLQLSQDKTSLITADNLGDIIESEFNIRGKSFTSKQGVMNLYNNLDVWKIKVIEKSTETIKEQTDEEDDLPF